MCQQTVYVIGEVSGQQLLVRFGRSQKLHLNFQLHEGWFSNPCIIQLYFK